MALRDKIPHTETLTVLGEQVVVIPIDFERYVELQEWLAENRSTKDEKMTKADRTRFGIEFGVKCLQYACPNEALTDEEAHAVFRASGGIMGTLAQKAMAACGHPMEVGTATHLPT